MRRSNLPLDGSNRRQPLDDNNLTTPFNADRPKTTKTMFVDDERTRRNLKRPDPKALVSSLFGGYQSLQWWRLSCTVAGGA